MYILASSGRLYVSISDHFGTPKIAKFAPWCPPFQFGTIYSRRFNISLFPSHLSTYFYFDICTCCWFLVQYLSISISFPLTHSSVNFYHNLDVGNIFYIFSFLFLISLNFHLIVLWLFLLLNIVQRASFVSIECGSHCKACANVPMFQQICCPPLACQFFLLAGPIVLKSHLDLFTNHCWICSPTVCAFVPNQLWTCV